MEKTMLMRSLYRALCRRSLGSSPAVATAAVVNGGRHLHHHSSLPAFSPIRKLPPDIHSCFTMRIGSTRLFSEDVTHMPAIKDPEIESAFKDLMATNWDELPAAVVHDVKKALSKSTDDKAAQEALANVFRSAEAVEEFTGILTSLKMAIDDSIGLSGRGDMNYLDLQTDLLQPFYLVQYIDLYFVQDVKPMPEEFVNALRTVYQRYVAYLDAFDPEEGYLKKKVETELGTKMIHLKLRCSGLGPEWGKVTVLGTSGLAGSYVEQRA